MKNLSPIKKIVLGLAAMCVAISIITANNLASVMMLIAAKNNAENNAQVVQQGTVQQGTVQQGSSTSTGGSTSAGTSTDSTAGSSTSTGSSSSSSSNSSTAGGTSSSDNSASAQSNGAFTNQQMVDMYKKAITSAKSSATSVVRVKDGALNYNGIVEAGGLSEVGKTLMDQFMVGSEAEIETKNEPWEKEKLPPEGAACNLTVNGIQNISCKENGDEYIITVVAKNETNPKPGADGVGSISNVIQESSITGAIGSFPLLKLENIGLAYENVTTVATIDKATGNLKYLKVNAPCVLSLTAKMGISVNAKVGIQVITEYEVKY